MKRLLLISFAVAGLVVAGAGVSTAAPGGVYDVKDYGAKGNGSTNDSGAIDKAITAANAAGGGTVRFTSGTYKSANTVHLNSNVTLQLDAGATITG